MGTILFAGLNSLSVTYTPNDTTDYASVTKSVSITVSKVTPTIIWPNPASISYPTALSNTQLDATANVAGTTLTGTFVYSPLVGTVLSAGSHVLSVTFRPNDTTDYNSVTHSLSISVTRTTPTITWSNPADISLGTALSSTQLDATASVPGTFVYSPAVGAKLTAGSHTLMVTFRPADPFDYNQVTRSVTINVDAVAGPVDLNSTNALANDAALVAYVGESGASSNMSSTNNNGTLNPAALSVLYGASQG